MIYTADNLGEFKARMKSAFGNWISSLITSADELPSAMKTILNRASNNIIHRYETEIEKVFDTIAVLFGNESGAIDTDVIANDLLNLINIPARSTTIAGFNVTFGENEISVEMPKNILTQLIGIGKVKINQDDINKFLEMIK